MGFRVYRVDRGSKGVRGLAVFTGFFWPASVEFRVCRWGPAGCSLRKS